MFQVLVLLLVLPGIPSYNILSVFPYQGKSHQFMFHAIIKTLLEKGHSVTNLTPIPMKGNFTNYNEIVTPFPKYGWADVYDYKDMEYRSPSKFRENLNSLSNIFMEPLLNSNKWQKLLKDSESKFDAILLEIFFMQEQLVYLGHLFQAPVVSVSTLEFTPLEDYFSGTPRNPGLIPEWEMFAPHGMTLFQRVQNTLWWLTGLIEHHLLYLPQRQKSLLRAFNQTREAIPTLTDMLFDVDLHVCNSHPLLFYPRPVSPNVVYVPGLHITPEATILQKDLKSLLDTASQGVILFTFGGLSPISQLHNEVKEAFINAFKKLPYLVLWRSDVDIPGISANVKVEKWLPQQAILAHKNCKLFITHGGMLSKQEALFYGVPLVMVPIYGDQRINAAQTEGLGLGLTLNYNNITEESVLYSISKMLQKEKKTIDKISKVFQEEVNQSPQRLAYWIEYIIRNKDAKHIKPKVMHFFQRYLLDITLFILTIINIFMYILYKILGLCRPKLNRASEGKTKNKIKKT